MRGMRFVESDVVEHGVESRGKRFEFRETGEDGAITDVAMKNEGRALRHLHGVKFGGGRAHARFDRGRLGAFE